MHDACKMQCANLWKLVVHRSSSSFSTAYCIFSLSFRTRSHIDQWYSKISFSIEALHHRRYQQIVCPNRRALWTRSAYTIGLTYNTVIICLVLRPIGCVVPKPQALLHRMRKSLPRRIFTHQPNHEVANTARSRATDCPHATDEVHLGSRKSLHRQAPHWRAKPSNRS